MLTAKEMEVAELISQGHNDESIGHQLDITRDTVRRHMSHIFDKLGFRSRLELALWFLKQQEPPKRP